MLHLWSVFHVSKPSFKDLSAMSGDRKQRRIVGVAAAAWSLNVHSLTLICFGANLTQLLACYSWSYFRGYSRYIIFSNIGMARGLVAGSAYAWADTGYRYVTWYVSDMHAGLAVLPLWPVCIRECQRLCMHVSSQARP